MSNLQQNNYPYFVPNQVLTHERLNELQEYLSGEIATSRTGLIGTGIACGLTHAFNGTILTIDAGYGISSDGWLLHSGCNPVTFSHYTAYTDPSSTSSFMVSGTQIDLLELTNNSSHSALSSILPANQDRYVVVMYLEKQQFDLDNCVTGNCDDLGKRERLTVKYLLVEKTELSRLLITAPYNFTESDRIKRLNLQGLGTEMDFPTMTDKDDLIDAFESIVTYIAPILKSTIQDATENVYHTLLNLNTAERNRYATAMSKLDTFPVSRVSAQYEFDLCRDLVVAYREFVDTAWYFRHGACDGYVPDHPRFLMLGSFNMDDDWEFEEFRHFFREASASDRYNHEYLKMRLAFKRMIQMIESYDSTENHTTQYVITPGPDTPAALGDRAMPMYYHLSPTRLLRYWNPDRGLRQRQGTLLSYHTFVSGSVGTAVNYHASPLHYDQRESPFYRIEGHVGKKVKSALDSLTQLRDQHNLPFDILALSANANSSVIKFREVCRDNALAVMYLAARDELICLMKMVKNYFESFVASQATCYQELYDNGYPILPAAGETMSPTRVQGQALAPANLMTETDNVIAELPGDFFTFDFEQFMPVYNQMVQEAIDLKVAIRQLIFDLASDRIYRDSAPAYFHITFFLAQPLRYLNNIIDDCSYLKLARAYYQWQAALNGNRETASVPGFANKYSGLDHLAGVPKGGTFVLVYDETGQSNADDSVVIGDLALPNRCCESCEPVNPLAIGLPPEAAKVVYSEVLPGQSVTVEYPFIDTVGDLAGVGLGNATPGGSVDSNYNVNTSGFEQATYRMTLSEGNQTQPVHGSVSLLAANGGIGFERLRYDSNVNAKVGSKDLVTIGIKDDNTGKIVNTPVTVLVKSDCIPFLYAKDLHASTDDKTPVSLYVITQELMAGVTVRVPSGQAVRGTISVVTSGSPAQFVIQYDPNGFTGIDTFDYELVKNNEVATGTVTVSVHAFTDQSLTPMEIPPSVIESIGQGVGKSIQVTGSEISSPDVGVSYVSKSLYGEFKISNAQTGVLTYAALNNDFFRFGGETVTYALKNSKTGQTVTGQITMVPVPGDVDTVKDGDVAVFLKETEVLFTQRNPLISLEPSVILENRAAPGESGAGTTK